jgi:DNA-directed RNA polymerase specialized sigma24 family protein
MSEAEHPTDHSDMQALVDPRQDLERRETLRDLTEKRDLEEARLYRHRALGTISGADCDLLLRIRLEGQSLREVADARCCSYDATKKRAQRAYLAMAKAERHSAQKWMSPADGDRGLSTSGVHHAEAPTDH